MIFCINCGAQINDNSKLCPYCGCAVENIGDAFASGSGRGQTYGAQQPMQFYPYQPDPGAARGGFMGVFEKNILTCVLLCIVTCGLYGIYWFYTLTEDTNRISGEPNPTGGGMAIVLTFITCGIYSLYWIYKRGEFLDKFNAMRGRYDAGYSITFLVLSILGLDIVAYCLMQNELNHIAYGY